MAEIGAKGQGSGNAALAGGCLCGTVKFEIAGEPTLFQYCFCSRCRHVTGSAHAANLFYAAAGLRWTRGEGRVKQYSHPGTKRFGHAFCTECGSALPWLLNAGKHVAVPAGSLEEAPEQRPIQGIYAASRAAWYLDPAALPQHDELPPKN